MPNKTSIRLSLSPEAIASLEAKAKANGYIWGGRSNLSGYIEAWAMGKLDKDVSEAIAQVQNAIEELTKIVK